MVEGLWHTSFTVSDVKKSTEFYTNILGMEIKHEQVQNNEYTSKLVGYENANLKVVMLGFKDYDHGPSGHLLELVEYVSPKGFKVDVQTNNTGAAHMAFIVKDIQAKFQSMKKKGINFKAEKPVYVEYGRNKGGYTVYFLDPDGITLELFQPPNYLKEDNY